MRSRIANFDPNYVGNVVLAFLGNMLTFSHNAGGVLYEGKYSRLDEGYEIYGEYRVIKLSDEVELKLSCEVMGLNFVYEKLFLFYPYSGRIRIKSSGKFTPQQEQKMKDAGLHILALSDYLLDVSVTSNLHGERAMNSILPILFPNLNQ